MCEFAAYEPEVCWVGCVHKEDRAGRVGDAKVAAVGAVKLEVAPVVLGRLIDKMKAEAFKGVFAFRHWVLRRARFFTRALRFHSICSLKAFGARMIRMGPGPCPGNHGRDVRDAGPGRRNPMAALL